MVSATEHASWPSTTISPETKNLINLFFSLVDQKESHIGDRLATEVFAEDGKMIAGPATFVGSAGMVMVISSSPLNNDANGIRNQEMSRTRLGRGDCSPA
jgi:hypothetical protein